MGLLPYQKKAVWTEAVTIPISAVFCPSRRPAEAGGLGMYATGTIYWQNINRPTALVHNDYAANTGGGTWNDMFLSPPVPANGVVLKQRIVRMGDIKDGTSNTYLCGEKYLNPDAYADGMDGGDDNCAYCGFDPDINRYTNHVYPAPRQDTPGAGWGDYIYIFGSAHSGSFNMALCDGSVQSISYSIDLYVHEYLGNREDGNAIDGSEL
jgi:prepilin-type processing-associated H-X9-DG protein